MEPTLPIIMLLIATGIVVGFVNTLAGGGSIITLTVFTALGMPIQLANGTNRIAIMTQGLAASFTFVNKGLLDWRNNMWLCIPVVAGTIIGSQTAVTIDERIFQICLGIVLVGVLVFTVAGDKLFKRGDAAKKAPRPVLYAVFFLIGLYAGYMFVGTGYFIILAAMGMMRTDMVQANVIKAMLVCVSMPFSILIFMLNGEINYAWGLIHGAGNIIGAYLASQFAIDWGTKFLRWFMAAVVVVCLADLAGLISLRGLVLAIMG